MARPQRPRRWCSWDGKLIQGLYKCPDGRRRINATGRRFTEADERRAVRKFLDGEATQQQDRRVVLARRVVRAKPVPKSQPRNTLAAMKEERQEVVVSVPRDRNGEVR